MPASLNASLQALHDAVAYNATLIRFFAAPFAYEVGGRVPHDSRPLAASTL